MGVSLVRPLPVRLPRGDRRESSPSARAERALRGIERELRARADAAAERLRRLGERAVERARRAWSVPWVRFGAVPLALVLSLPPARLLHYLYLDRGELPDLEPLVRFEMPTVGEVYDSQGRLLMELAREYRHVVSYEQVPFVLRQAVLAAEDRNFFSHSGVDYGALPRVVARSLQRSLATLRSDSGFRLVFPQGGSTLTQQLVRGYFLRELTSREDGEAPLYGGLTPRLLGVLLGAPSANKLLRKLEEIRLALWLEEEMLRRAGSKEQAKREIFARYASFIYQGNGRYGFAASSDYYFGKPLQSYTLADAGKAALLAGIAKFPLHYAPSRGNARAVHRRNAILALMARHGFIAAPVAACLQREPLRVAARDPVKTTAPAAIGSVLEELERRGGERFGIEDLVEGRIAVVSTVDERIQAIVNEAMEKGLQLYERRHPRSAGAIQGSVVVLRNADAAILAEAGGRQVYQQRRASYSDYNRATQSLRQPGSAMKPLVYMAAFREGLDLDTVVPDEPIGVFLDAARGVKWISNYDHRFKGPIRLRDALAQSRNAVTARVASAIGLDSVLRIARELGIKTSLQPYIATALGASEVRLLELANVYRALASGLLAEPYAVERVSDDSGEVLYRARHPPTPFGSSELFLIQEGLYGVVQLPEGTAHALARPDFPIPVMGKTGTTNDYRDALFVGSTYGAEGITVAVHLGFDDNRPLGDQETGARAALPIFREIMLRVYREGLAGPVPEMPWDLRARFEEHLALRAAAPATLEAGAYDVAAPPVVYPTGEPIGLPAEPGPAVSARRPGPG